MITLTFNTKVRDAVQLIEDEEAFPILDLQGIRYLLDTSLKELGMIVYTPFDIATRTALGEKYQYLYGMQSTLSDAILGPGPRSVGAARVLEYPEFEKDEALKGNVTPRYTV